MPPFGDPHRHSRPHDAVPVVMYKLQNLIKAHWDQRCVVPLPVANELMVCLQQLTNYAHHIESKATIGTQTLAVAAASQTKASGASEKQLTQQGRCKKRGPACETCHDLKIRCDLRVICTHCAENGLPDCRPRVASRKLPVACESCHTAKTKCDHHRPCTRCRRLQLPGCRDHFPRNKRRNGTHKRRSSSCSSTSSESSHAFAAMGATLGNLASAAAASGGSGSLNGIDEAPKSESASSSSASSSRRSSASSMSPRGSATGSGGVSVGLLQPSTGGFGRNGGMLPTIPSLGKASSSLSSHRSARSSTTQAYGASAISAGYASGGTSSERRRRSYVVPTDATLSAVEAQTKAAQARVQAMASARAFLEAQTRAQAAGSGGSGGGKAQHGADTSMIANAFMRAQAKARSNSQGGIDLPLSDEQRAALYSMVSRRRLSNAELQTAYARAQAHPESMRHKAKVERQERVDANGRRLSHGRAFLPSMTPGMVLPPPLEHDASATSSSSSQSPGVSASAGNKSSSPARSPRSRGSAVSPLSPEQIQQALASEKDAQRTHGQKRKKSSELANSSKSKGARRSHSRSSSSTRSLGEVGVVLAASAAATAAATDRNTPKVLISGVLSDSNASSPPRRHVRTPVGSGANASVGGDKPENADSSSFAGGRGLPPYLLRHIKSPSAEIDSNLPPIGSQNSQRRLSDSLLKGMGVPLPPTAGDGTTSDESMFTPRESEDNSSHTKLDPHKYPLSSRLARAAQLHRDEGNRSGGSGGGGSGGGGSGGGGSGLHTRVQELSLDHQKPEGDLDRDSDEDAAGPSRSHDQRPLKRARRSAAEARRLRSRSSSDTDD